ncbi:MAG TPA: hypothetical protein ENH82_12150 [bacterium]|nr:hypothetical protein [bacterium]
METLIEYVWIIVIIFLIWISYRLWKVGKYRDPGQENTYYASTKKRNPFECPYDIEARSCQHYNGATGYTDVPCIDCGWYNKGIKPSKF